VFYLLEIRDADGSSFNELCKALPQYTCEINRRAGRSSSKEQIGIFYKNIELTTITDFRDTADNFERPPLLTLWNVGTYQLQMYAVHLKPDDVKAELAALEVIVPDASNIVIIGDLNADCSYYNPSEEPEFDNLNWIIPDSADTTVSDTDCAYDRILLNNNAKTKFVSYNIVTNFTKEQSDHYLIEYNFKR